MMEPAGELAQGRQTHAHGVVRFQKKGRALRRLRQPKALFPSLARLVVLRPRHVKHPESPKDLEYQRAFAHLVAKLTRAGQLLTRLLGCEALRNHHGRSESHPKKKLLLKV